jgi:hypothetical protein
LTAVYTQTGELISSVDYRQNLFQPLQTDWADQTIVYESPRLGDTALSMQFRDVEFGDPVLVASCWIEFGEVIDPTAVTDNAPNYQYFCGNYLPEYITGVRAWLNVNPVSVATVGSNLEMSSMGPCRVSITGDLFAIKTVASGVSPYISTIIP